jgi:uncharacterized protein YndB with AHSA1/START domain
VQPIVEVRTISRPLADVYAYLTDTRHLADWVPGAERLKPLAGAPRVGDVVTFDVGRMANSLTFTALEPPRFFRNSRAASLLTDVRSLSIRHRLSGASRRKLYCSMSS